MKIGRIIGGVLLSIVGLLMITGAVVQIVGAGSIGTAITGIMLGIVLLGVGIILVRKGKAG